jgi:hypothetical protein
MSGKYENSSPKIRALQIGPERENGDFLENDYNDFDSILAVYEDCISNYNYTCTVCA